jgi:pyruvate/2-oxoglutarate dehydrogenase complex dihydrolipoamide dehydrogenase (E3) component
MTAEKTSSPPNQATSEFDILILGGGTGATLAAWTFASEGKRVAMIHRRYIGGSCPNIACLPSKNIIHSAKVLGVGAGEILAAVQVAMIAGLPYTALRDAVLTHPTLAEGLIPLFSSVASVHNASARGRAKLRAA